MAHRILGLDIGHRALKLAVVDKTLRQTSLIAFDEEVLPPGAEEETTRAALQKLLQRNLRPDDVLSVALPASACLHRTLAFPFRDDKAIAEAVGFELENHIPTPLSELVVDFVRIGEKDGQTEVLAVAAPRKQVEERLALLKNAGMDARRLGLTTLAYGSLVKALPSTSTGLTLLVDVGERGSDVVVLRDGHTQFVRSLSVGAQAMAQIFATHFQSDLAPTDLLARHGWLLPPNPTGPYWGAVPESSDERRVHEATSAAVEPLLRELRVTLSAWMRKAHERPDRVVLTGGIAGLRGVFDHLERALGLPVTPVRLDELPDNRLADQVGLGDRGALAVALALQAADPNTDGDVDFRQGDLAYEGDFRVLRERLPQIAAFVVIALCLMGIRTSLGYRALVIEQEQQVRQLQTLSKTLTGKTMSSFTDLQRELNREPTLDVAGLYPDMSAFKVLEEISTIVDKVTEPPDYVPPGGPGSTRPPGEPEAPRFEGRAAQVDPGRLDPMLQRGGGAVHRGLPGLDGSMPAPGDGGGPPVRGRPGRGGDDSDPGERGAAAEGGGAGAEGGGAGAEGGGAGAEGGGAGGEGQAGAFGGHKIELSAVQVDRSGATIRGDADTQEALLALQQAIDAHRCFGKAKSSSDRITFERHKDWFKFTIQFEVACPVDEPKAAGKPKKAGADKAAETKEEGKGKAADDEAGDEE